MDGTRFDDLARALARPASRRGALAALAALLPAASAAPPTAARRRRGCRPKCAAGFACEKRECVCPSGVACSAVCCQSGQACEGGACVTPQPPPVCVPAGGACKGLGRPCCDGRVCASGQGGRDDIACWVPAGGACGTSSECVYGSTCRDGACVANVPEPCTVCARGCPHATIESAIADAALDTIRVGAGTYRPDDGRSETHALLIDRPVTVEACGDGPVTIDGGGTKGVVLVMSRSVHEPLSATLRGLSIVNGRAWLGGGVRNGNEGGELTLDSVTVAGCASDEEGGGIFNYTGSGMTITGASVIRDNVALTHGGGIGNDIDARLRIEGTTVIRGNRAVMLGGGVFHHDGPGLFLGGQVSITGNSAANGGGLFAGSAVTCAGAPRVCGNSATDCFDNCNGDQVDDPGCAGVCCPDGRGARVC